VKILEVTNVDFSLRQFVLPLMRGLRDAGHEVIGVCADGQHLEAVRAEGFAVRPVPMARSLSPLAQWRALRSLIRLIRREKPAIVHAHMPISGLLARLAARVCGVPTIAYTGHGFLFNQPGSRRRRIAARVLEWLAGRVTDLYMTVSTEEAADARRLRLHRRPIGIGNGRDPARFAPDPAARVRVRTELGAAPDAIVVLAVSRLVRHKGYPELLRAMELVPDATLWIAGARLASDHGQDMADVFADAAARLGSRLKLLGYREDTEALLAAADIFVLPSHFEGLPMSIIEAMQTGLAVVATDIRGPREQIVNEESGLLVPPGLSAPLGQAIARLARDPALRARLGQAARARACALYDEDVVVRRTVALLERAARS
jgi:glycosyltransferase involved in cell wall biosynthesis